MACNVLKIADVAFQMDSDVTFGEPDPGYREFRGGGDGSADTVRVELRRGSRPSTECKRVLFDASPAWVFHRDDDFGWFRASPAGPTRESPWVAQVAVDTGKVILHVADGYSQDSICPLRYPLDQLLLTWFLGFLGGCLVHAAGLELDGRGIILCGTSGAGKSTISRLLAECPGASILSDDRVVLRRNCDGFQVYGTPWPGDAGYALNRRTVLSTIMFLSKGSGNRLERLACGEVIERLMPVISMPWYDEARSLATIGFLETVVAKVPAYNLEFTNDGSAREFLMTEIRQLEDA